MQHKSYYKRNLLGCRSGENTAGVVIDSSKPNRLGGKGNEFAKVWSTKQEG